MARQPAVGIVVPQNRLSPVRHMLMPERAGTHGFDDGRPRRAANPEGHLNRCPITVLLVGAARAFFANWPIGEKNSLRSKTASKIPSEQLFFEHRHHRGSSQV